MSTREIHKGIEKNGARVRICDCCGKTESIRKDNRSTTCLSCSCRRNGEKGWEVLRSRTPVATCSNCGKQFKRSKSTMQTAEKYCSLDCRRSHKKVTRECLACGQSFLVTRSVLSGRTNSSGNFCCRNCYASWLCKPDRVSGRGSQWEKARRETLAKQPFCAFCGTFKFLQVHHIVPFRLTQDNSRRNLIPLCRKCHKQVEWVTTQVEVAGFGHGGIGRVLRRALRYRQTLTLIKLREINASLTVRTLADRADRRIRP